MKNLFFALSYFYSHSIESHWIYTAFIPLRLFFREALERIFTKYGPVTGVVVNERKGGSALVEFADTASARMAANIETGFMDNPFKVKPLFEDGLPQSTNSASHLNKSKQFSSVLKVSTSIKSGTRYPWGCI
jgi:hypothetical protein